MSSLRAQLTPGSDAQPLETEDTRLVEASKDRPAAPKAKDGDAAPRTAPAPAASSGESPERASAPPPPVIADDVGPDLLSELLGRGIAASLREQFAALAERIDAATADPAVKAGWRDRLARLDPDGWESPEAVLAGMGSVQPGIDAITAELDRAAAGA